METPINKFDVGKWEAWFAWHPAHLCGGAKFAWLRRISRRFMLTGPKHLRTEYTERPVIFHRTMAREAVEAQLPGE